MIRILHVVNDMHRAGLETMLMNYYRNIDRNIIQFDFLTHRPYKSDYDDEIISMGGKVFYAPRLYPQNYHKYFKWMKVFFKEHPEYKIIHSHIDSMSFLPLLAAKKAGIPIRIAHSHNTSIDFDYKFFLKEFFRIMINKVATHRVACSYMAGKYLFKSKYFTIWHNSIDVNKFEFNITKREKFRDDNLLQNQFIVGHVGRFARQKNHIFLLKIFKKILTLEPNSKLILVGDGKTKNKIGKKVIKMDLNNKVLFLGNREDVDLIYQAIDVFVLPSLYEGLPVVGIEAQYSGLPCVFSDSITKEVYISQKCNFISLNAKVEKWVKCILQYKNDDHKCKLFNDDFNIKNSNEKVIKFYNSLLGDKV